MIQSFPLRIRSVTLGAFTLWTLQFAESGSSDGLSCLCQCSTEAGKKYGEGAGGRAWRQTECFQTRGQS